MGNTSVRNTWSQALNAAALMQQVAELLTETNPDSSFAAVHTLFDESVVWSHPANPSLVPFGGRRSGLEGVLRCLRSGSQTVQIASCKITGQRYYANRVCADLSVSARVKSTGKFYTIQSVLMLETTPQGKIRLISQIGSAHAMEAAFR